MWKVDDTKFLQIPCFSQGMFDSFNNYVYKNDYYSFKLPFYMSIYSKSWEYPEFTIGMRKRVLNPMCISQCLLALLTWYYDMKLLSNLKYTKKNLYLYEMIVFVSDNVDTTVNFFDQHVPLHSIHLHADLGPVDIKFMFSM
jgi:hypothetical protein